jgi:chlorophyllide a hydrolase
MYGTWFALAWAATLMAAGGYILSVGKGEVGNYGVGDILLFSVLDGVLEQFMFVFWFLFGCWMTRLATRKSAIVFTGGLFAFVIYSALIHQLFWVKVWPAHTRTRTLWLWTLSIMSLLWMWVFWRCRRLVPIIAMHAVLDFLITTYLNSNWLNAIT